MNNDKNLELLEYGSSSITEAVGAEKHRMYVSQYLYTDDVIGIENQLFEISDNGADDIVEYHGLLERIYNKKFPPICMEVTIHPTDEVTVKDYSRGLPCNKHPETGIEGIYKIYESDSAGAKGAHNKDGKGYVGGTSGQHGAGAAVSKSCASYFNIKTATRGEKGEGAGVFILGYTRGQRSKELTKISELKLSTIEEYSSLGLQETGTEINYKYDETLFTKTFNGQPSEAYRKDSIVERYRFSLLGIGNKDAIIIKFKYKDDEEMIITPYDLTPEMFLNAKDPSRMISIPMISSKLPTDNAFFKGTVYIYQDDTGFKFESKTVVNRLSLNSADFNRIVETKLETVYTDAIKSRFFRLGGKSMPRRNSVGKSILSKHRVLMVMELKKASFTGQTKRDLKSSEYIPEFSQLMEKAIFDNLKGFFNAYIDLGVEELRELEKTEIQNAKNDEKIKARAEINKQQQDIKKSAIKAANSPIERLRQQREMVNKDTPDRFIYKPSIYKVEASWLALVEGPSAAGALGDITDLPITVVGLGGKPTNINNEAKLLYSQLVALAAQLYMPYIGILLLADADSDALHIKVLLIAIIMKYAPHYIKQKRVFIINSPHAKIKNNNPVDVEIELQGRKIIYPPGVYSFTKSPVETELALSCDNMELREKYGGLADSLSDGDGEIDLKDLVTDPTYRSVVKPPTAKELAMLQDILSTQSNLKKEFINSICTKRMIYAQRISSINDNVRIDSGNLSKYKYVASPKIQMHRSYEI